MDDNSTGNLRIDVHHHVVPPEFTDDSMPIKLPDTEAQLRSMDSWHIQSAVTSLTPRVLLKNLHRLREVARICNEFQARRIAEHPARFRLQQREGGLGARLRLPQREREDAAVPGRHGEGA